MTVAILASGVALHSSQACAQAQPPLTGSMMDGRTAAASAMPEAAATPDLDQGLRQGVREATTTPSAAAGAAPLATPQTIAARSTPGIETQIGDVTTLLLTAQADGSVAAPRLPMLGATATAAYTRYVNSFSHPIPEYFDKKIKDEQTSSSGS